MKYKITATEATTVVKLLSGAADASLYDIRRQLKRREVKVNGVRINEDRPLFPGDEAEIFLPRTMLLDREKAYAVYRDENIVVACKFPDTPTERVAADLGRPELKPVHRLDRNTSGLIVLAADAQSEAILQAAIKARKLEKLYYAEIAGVAECGGRRTAYLKKMPEKSEVLISDEPRPGYVEIVTEFETVCKKERTSVVRIRLVTGRTHQIRAYFRHIGHPVIGDDKYGDRVRNRTEGALFPRLTAYKLVFGGLTGKLSYLNGKIIELDKEKLNFIY